LIIIQLNEVFGVQNFSIRPKDVRSKGSTHEFELSTGSTTELYVPVDEIPLVSFEATKVSEMNGMADGTFVG